MASGVVWTVPHLTILPSPPLPSPLPSPPKVHFSGRGWLLRFLALVWTAKTDSHFSIGNVLGLGPITLLSSAALQASVLKVGAAYLSALDVESLVAICSQTCPCECTSPAYHPTTLTHSHPHSLTHSHSHSLPPHSHSHSLPLSLTPPHSHSRSLPPSLAPPHSYPHSLTPPSHPFLPCSLLCSDTLAVDTIA